MQEVGGRGDEAEDEKAVGWKVVEMAGVDDDVMLAKQVDGEIFVGGICGDAEDGIPAGIGVKEFAGGLRAQEGLEVRAIFADAIEKLLAKGMALSEESWKSGLRGGAEGEIGVGDDLEAIESGLDVRIGAGDGEPGNFHLRQGGDFGETAEGEGERGGVGGKCLSRPHVEGEVEEYFVDDQGEIVFLAEGVEASDFLRVDVGAGGIVGMDEKDGAGARRDGALERLKIDEPAVGVGEGVRNKIHILKSGKKFEKRIAGLGEKKLVAGIAEEAKGVRVGFAGAGGEKERFGIDGGLMVVEVVAGDFAAGGESAFGLRIKGEGRWILEGGKDGAGVVVEPAMSGIRGGEIEEGNSGGAEFVESEGEGVAGEGPEGASGEHGES